MYSSDIISKLSIASLNPIMQLMDSGPYLCISVSLVAASVDRQNLDPDCIGSNDDQEELSKILVCRIINMLRHHICLSVASYLPDSW